MILYEYPFNERIRTYLRLEHLHHRLAQLIPRDHPLDHHYALACMFEIIDVAARADLKSDVLKDLERQKQGFIQFRGNPSIAEAALEGVIGQLEADFSALNAQAGKAGTALSENEWLTNLRSRMSIPAGTCGFDLPAYLAWQHRPAAERRAQLIAWASTLAPMADSVDLLMRLLRESGTSQKVFAEKGVYQQPLPQGKTFQLLRMRIDPDLGLIPEISGNRLMVSIRFMRQVDDGRLTHEPSDTSFELALCA